MTPGERAYREIVEEGRAATAERWRAAALWQLDEIRRALAAPEPPPPPKRHRSKAG